MFITVFSQILFLFSQVLFTISHPSSVRWIWFSFWKLYLCGCLMRFIKASQASYNSWNWVCWVSQSDGWSYGAIFCSALTHWSTIKIAIDFWHFRYLTLAKDIWYLILAMEFKVFDIGQVLCKWSNIGMAMDIQIQPK